MAGLLFPGTPTKFGLKEKLLRDWDVQIAACGLQDEYNTTYGSSYHDLPRDSMAKTRHGIPALLSTTLHKANSINKNLQLRGKMTLQSPEGMP